MWFTERPAFLAIKQGIGASVRSKMRELLLKINAFRANSSSSPASSRKSMPQITRSERLAKTLRENLKRRKAQIRGRAGARQDSKGGEMQEEAGETATPAPEHQTKTEKQTNG